MVGVTKGVTKGVVEDEVPGGGGRRQLLQEDVGGTLLGGEEGFELAGEDTEEVVTANGELD